AAGADRARATLRRERRPRPAHPGDGSGGGGQPARARPGRGGRARAGVAPAHPRRGPAGDLAARERRGHRRPALGRRRRVRAQPDRAPSRCRRRRVRAGPGLHRSPPARADHRQPARQQRPPRRAAGRRGGAGADDRRVGFGARLRPGHARACHRAVRHGRHRPRTRDRPRPLHRRRPGARARRRPAGREPARGRGRGDGRAERPRADRGAGLVRRWLALAGVAAACTACGSGPGLVGSLVKVDSGTGRRVGAPVPLPPAGQPYLLAVGPDGVWLAAGVRLWRVDPDTAQVTSAGPLPGRATALQDAGGAVWTTVTMTGGGRLVRVDPVAGKITAEAPVGPAPSALTVASDSAWVTDSVDQSILRFSLAKEEIRRAGAVALPRSPVRAPTQITVYNGFVWVYERGRVLRISASTDRVLGTTTIASVPGGTIAAGSGGIWVITRTPARGLGAVRLLDGATGLAAGNRIVVGGRPTAIVTDG